MNPSLSTAYRILGTLSAEQAETVKDLVQSYNTIIALREGANDVQELASFHQDVLQTRAHFYRIIVDELLKRAENFNTKHV